MDCCVSSQVRGYSGAQGRAQTLLARPALLDTSRTATGKKVLLQAAAPCLPPGLLHHRRTRTGKVVPCQKLLRSLLRNRSTQRPRKPQRRGSLKAKRSDGPSGWSPLGCRLTYALVVSFYFTSMDYYRSCLCSNKYRACVFVCWLSSYWGLALGSVVAGNKHLPLLSTVLTVAFPLKLMRDTVVSINSAGPYAAKCHQTLSDYFI